MILSLNQQIRKAVFIILFLFAAAPLVSSVTALVAGILFSIFIGNPYPIKSAKVSKALLQLSVVGLGFNIDIHSVLNIGAGSIPLTLTTIAATVIAGALIGCIMAVPANTYRLISFGTAICGGSAIVAMAPVIRAKDEEIAVALATVFSLNAVALIIFQPIGELVGLSQQQFGLWAALAIHDTSSVVASTAGYGAVALSVGTTVKLTRALWIAPATLAAGLIFNTKNKTKIPLFIFGFITAATINSFLPEFDSLWGTIHNISKQTLAMTLFLIGTGLSVATLRQIGPKPFILGSLLWIIVSITTLFLISSNLIG